MIYSRDIFPELKAHLPKKQATIITGLRRTGKTTLVRELLKLVPDNTLYFDLERIDNRELFRESNYDEIVRAFEHQGLVKSRRMVIAIDEIQYVKNLPSVVKYLQDTYTIKFILTGSSSFYIKNLFSESLSGRKKLFEVTPLSFGEYLIFQGIVAKSSTWQRARINKIEFQRLTGLYEEYIKYGGFPEVVLSHDYEDKTDILKDIISSYFTIDIRTIADIGDERNLYRLLKLLIERVGNRVDSSKLSRISGISRPTVMNYLDLLEKTGMIYLIPAYTTNIDRELVKARKVYFADTGIVRTLGDIGSGQLFENAILCQLRKTGEVRYYARKTGAEIDFIMNNCAYEVKETPSSYDKKSLSTISDSIGIHSHDLIGRYLSPSFHEYIWGGDIR